jgi:antitoxin YefM
MSREESTMPIDATYTSLRENLASVLDRVIDDQEVVIVRRRGARDVALIAADELNSLLETAHLLHSPRNAERLKASLKEARQGKGKRMSLKQLREAVGLDAED